ncbi:potassium/sodium hyperpolarization-activated cyclic nucleotide-gated channel 2-like [Diorhabda carinulata]|uniref:potassium/sodium hyperpolarization-activated cyclic nucleotide-gated channel 2-like n=1 Tax=Diorhabda carinulata TaxID=1163345 RepID=UPI0025A06E2F|nr:potassium/sodium hyperpolarization-activated cyclic nucleotide-gated channel 2-like [Diorhabda carinulata]
MPHSCNLISSDEVTEKIEDVKKKSKLTKWWLKFLLISEDHPLVSSYFKSKKEIHMEKLRHIRSGYTYVIHPLSKFRYIYEIYLLVYYILVVYINPLDVGVTYEKIKPIHLMISRIVDVLTMIDIIITFFSGFIVSKTKTIELRPFNIARNYIVGPFFIFDLMGSSKVILYAIIKKQPLILIGFINICCLCRSIRIWTLMKSINKLFMFLHVKSKTTLFTFCSVLLVFFTMHFLACFLVGIEIIRKYNFVASDSRNNSIITNIYDVYPDFTFRSSAYIFGITVPKEYLNEMDTIEDYLFVIFTYVIGKILMISTWLIIALSILSTRSTNIKFQKVLKEVEEYMIQKKLPPNLRTNIISYYNFKYQESYFKEDLIQFILPDNLRKDINLGICKYLVNNVSIFEHLKYEEVIEIVEVLIPEIFLPKDYIIQYGEIGESMYFIASGTVAVYTYSGKEICHLEDGAYFGEISLVMKDQKRTANIHAIETSHIYKLRKTDFQKIFSKHQKIFKKITRGAEKRLKHIMRVEELHKKTLFEKSRIESLTSASSQLTF